MDIDYSHPLLIAAVALGTGVLLATIYWRFFWFPAHVKRFRNRSRQVIKGQVTEQLAPFLPGFPYRPSEVKFIGKPVDMIVFEGLESGVVENIVFLEIKSTSRARLTAAERSIRDAVRKKHVSWAVYRFDGD